MNQDQFDWFVSRIIATLIVVILILLAVIFAGATYGFAEEDEENWTEAWVLCQPDSWVNSHHFPKKGSEVNAYIFPGTKIFLDGKQKRGFVHAVGMNSEDGDGWVSKGFIVYSEPVEDGHRYPCMCQRQSGRKTVYRRNQTALAS